MIDYVDVQNEINKLENCGTTNYSVCEKLSILYNVRDHAEEKPRQERYAKELSFAGSDFVAAAMKAPQEELIKILDEHMEALRTIYPKEYEIIMRKIKKII